ncbi:hypothetical protein E2R68_02360 [Psychromonas sp. RZ22]|uniref:hypothetical protein n=1 Tax=Psychromonas algarum TaxID=2555643 RepID=UPI00106767AA|nr:hypothetical protein [Psychromonas sp. RZ22]TEW55955.1 hypothetical protein E2R68_02360 [Psychromonas sp. RZ22]
MRTENIIAIQSKTILAQVCYEEEKRKLKLRPCFSAKLPINTKIECHKNLSQYNIGETIEVDLVEMVTSNGHSYLYSY